MKNERKQVILQTLAKLLETRSPSKVTTALLAKESGITEAALYRHFPSKRRIFLELFNFCDDSIRSKVTELKKTKSKDIENLVKRVQKRVYEKTGVNLELEIKIVGE